MASQRWVLSCGFERCFIPVVAEEKNENTEKKCVPDGTNKNGQLLV